MNHVIWQNYDVDPEYYKDYLEEWFPEVEDEYEKQRIVEELNNSYFEDEIMNLSIQLPTEIIAIADLGLWNGRVKGYKELNSKNLSSCLQFGNDCWYAEWYVDRYKNLRSRQSHHDGTNHILYRRWKDGISEEKKENFLSKVYEGKATSNDLSRYTCRLGDEVLRTYGWK